MGRPGRSSNEGTAARTRPFSYEEIMLRRKKKLTTDIVEKSQELRELSAKDNAKGALDHLKADRAHKSVKDPKDTVKCTSGEALEVISKRVVDCIEDKDKQNLDSEASVKAKSSYNKSSRVKETKNAKQGLHRSRNDDRLAADSDKEFDKRQHRATAEKNKSKEKSSKSGREEKRKYHAYNDEKTRSDIDSSNMKKHDSGKFHVVHPERNDRKKEHSKHYYEESRSKRRRSSSREYDRDRDRDRRSASFSPRAHKRFYHGREYEDSSLHSFKDKSRRKYSDGDKHRTSGNGGYASGHYRKHGSGLGGYSPRKRRSEAAIKTPSPTVRSPEKKSATWDQPPAGHSGFGSTLANFQSTTSKMHELASSISVADATTKSQPTSSLETVSRVVNASIDSVQLTQATRPRRRLYVENLPPSSSEKTVIDCLNGFLLSSGVNHIQGTTPCISCIINDEKRQALVEFLTPEDATSALSFNGKSLSGYILKIRRPKDFVEAATGAPEKTVEEVKAISDVVMDSPHKIFVGGISKALTSDMLIEIVSAFGNLRAYRFEINEDLNGPCAFLEYVDHSITLNACAGLNGMKLGGSVLTAVLYQPIGHGEQENAESGTCYDIPKHAKPLLAASTEVLLLKNVLSREELLLLSEAGLEETLEDIRLECARFGTVKSVNIVRHNSSNEAAAEASGPDSFRNCADTESQTESPGRDAEQDGNVPPLNDAREPHYLRSVSDGTHDNDKMPIKDLDKESTDLSPVNGATVCEVTKQLCDPSGEPSPDLKEHVDIKTGGANVENALVSETQKLEEVEAVDAENVDSNRTAAEKAESTEVDWEHISMGSTNTNATAGPGAEGNKGDGKHTSVDNIDSNAKGVGKAGSSNGSDTQVHDLDLFEPGCVLVEFLRKEATCMAAHCLHGRTYGERIVTAGYVPHDIYLARFLK